MKTTCREILGLFQFICGLYKKKAIVTSDSILMEARQLDLNNVDSEMFYSGFVVKLNSDDI